MTPHLLTIGTSLAAIPVAVVFSTQFLPAEKSAVVVKSKSPDGQMKASERRAHQMSSTLAQIEGWSHGGLNEY